MTVVKTQRTKKQIGAEIKRLRKSYNMTQVKLGMILNIDLTKISKIESGTESSLDAFLLMEICEIFDTSLDRLCYTTVEDEAEIDASEAFNIILNAEYTERKTVMKMLSKRQIKCAYKPRLLLSIIEYSNKIEKSEDIYEVGYR